MNYGGYTQIVRGMPMKMDGGLPYSNQYCLWVPPGFNSPDTTRGLGKTLNRFAMGFAQVQNRSGFGAVFGVGARLDMTRWRAGTWTNATTTFTDKTAQAQEATANDVPLETLTNNDGFVVSGLDVFNCVAINVTTISVGGTPVHDLAYSGPSGWTTLTSGLVMPPSVWSSGEQLIWFAPPPDWTPMTVANHGTGVPVGYYGMRSRASTAPTTTAALAGSLSVAQIYGNMDGMGSLSVLNTARGSEHRFTCYADAMVAVASTSNQQNIFEVAVKVLG